MEFFDVLKTRRSVRAFKDTRLTSQQAEKILDAVISAPSAGNLQAYELVIVKDRRTKERLAEACLDQEFVAQAPIVLVFFANPDRSARKYGQRGAALYALQDATIAAAYAQLAATALGLSSAWVGAFDDRAISTAVHAPERLKPVAVIPIGQADEEPEKTPRTRSVLHEEGF